MYNIFINVLKPSCVNYFCSVEGQEPHVALAHTYMHVPDIPSLSQCLINGLQHGAVRWVIAAPCLLQQSAHLQHLLAVQLLHYRLQVGPACCPKVYLDKWPRIEALEKRLGRVLL